MRLITLLVLSSLATNLWANEPTIKNQCEIITPFIASKDLPEINLINDSVSIMSDHATIQYPSVLDYHGNVTFQQNKKFIRADKARYDESTNLFSASGNLHFQDQNLTLVSDSLTTLLSGEKTQLTTNKYWFNNSMIHGQSDSFDVVSGRYLSLKNASFTTCPGDTPDWALSAEEINIDTTRAWATISNATLEVFEVPVFYFPYLTLPISDKRSSGFLYPSIGSSSDNGLEISTPYYWNIAPNYDMTITPRIMTKRGLQLNTELRYLDKGQQGLANIEYLHNDRTINEKRYLFYWQHTGKFNENWRIATDFTQVSDDNYFNDIGSDYGNSTDNQLIKSIDLGYYTDDWWLNMRIQDIQVLGQQTDPYVLLPQISFHSYHNTLGDYFEYDLFSELSHFQRNNGIEEKTSRLHAEPTLRLPLSFSSFNVTSEFKLMQTWYQQDSGDNESSISRTLPQFKLYADVDFERSIKSSPGFTQTLTPKIQYLYVPYENQQDIGIYDTALLRDDYTGLFRERRFSGLDRIVDTNQVTLGMTTTIRNKDNLPQFTASIGQTFYLERSRTFEEQNDTNTDEIFPDRSSLAGELSYIINERWKLNHAMQLNEQQNSVTQSKSTLDYQLSQSKLVQLNHRYVKDINDDKINQLGISTVWPINHDWTFVSNFYRDMNLNRTIETFAGLQYESCCWAIRFQAYRQLQAQYIDGSDNITTEEFDSGFSFSFQIKGLGANSPINASDMLNNGLFSYRRPYYLKN